MNKYSKPVYNKKTVEESQKISFWEKIALLFVKKIRVENEESVSHFKKFNGKFYLLDFKLKSL